MRFKDRRFAVGLLLAALAVSRVEAAEVPARLGLLVLLKVLTYDAGFEARVAQGEFLVLVPFEPAGAEAAKSLVTEALALPIKSVLGRGLKFETIPVLELEAQLIARSAAAVLVPSGLAADQARQLAAIATRHNRYSMTLEPELVKAGITVGVAPNNGKAQLILNVPAARAIKAEFSPSVMKVARLQH